MDNAYNRKLVKIIARVLVGTILILIYYPAQILFFIPAVLYWVVSANDDWTLLSILNDKIAQPLVDWSLKCKR